jgi:hypothetical protein
MCGLKLFLEHFVLMVCIASDWKARVRFVNHHHVMVLGGKKAGNHVIVVIGGYLLSLVAMEVLGEGSNWHLWRPLLPGAMKHFANTISLNPGDSFVRWTVETPLSR